MSQVAFQSVLSFLKKFVMQLEEQLFKKHKHKLSLDVRDEGHVVIWQQLIVEAKKIKTTFGWTISIPHTAFWGA